MDLNEKALEMHKQWNGKLETVAKSKVSSREDLAIAYTPGVAEPCKVIAKDPAAAYTYTMKANTVAVVSDGSAVLGREASCIFGCLQGVHGDKVLVEFLLQSVELCLDVRLVCIAHHRRAVFFYNGQALRHSVPGDNTKRPI